MRVARLDRAQFGMLVAESKAFSDRMVASMEVRIEGLEAQAAGKLRLPIVVGRAHDPDCHSMRDFLSRNQVRFEWADPEDSWVEGRLDLAPALRAAVDCSVLMLPDGRVLSRPTQSELATAVGLQVEPEHETYDVVVIGGGPTGLAAAVYGASEGLRTLLVERVATGGQAGTSSRIENYLGFPSGVSGDDLAANAREQALRLGAEIVVTRSIHTITPHEDCHTVTLDGGRVLGARAVILATGVAYRALDATGIEAYTGIGCFYGAARTEAAAMRGRDVILVGGGNSAGQAAMFFSDYARSVTILIRGASLDASMSRYLIDELARKPTVTVRTGGEIVEVSGDVRLERVKIRNREDGSIDEVRGRRRLHLHRRRRQHELAVRQDRARRARLHLHRARRRRRDAGGVAARARRVPARDERAGHLRRRRRAARQHQARGVGRGRGQHRDRVRAPAPRGDRGAAGRGGAGGLNRGTRSGGETARAIPSYGRAVAERDDQARPRISRPRLPHPRTASGAPPRRSRAGCSGAAARRGRASMPGSTRGRARRPRARPAATGLPREADRS